MVNLTIFVMMMNRTSYPHQGSPDGTQVMKIMLIANGLFKLDRNSLLNSKWLFLNLNPVHQTVNLIISHLKQKIQEGFRVTSDWLSLLASRINHERQHENQYKDQANGCRGEIKNI